MENVTSDQFKAVADSVIKTKAKVDAMADKVEVLGAWRNKIIGGFLLILAVLGLVTTVITAVGQRWIAQSDKMNETLVAQSTAMNMQMTTLNTNFQVFQERVQPFITAGPSFTEKDYNTHSALEHAKLRQELNGQCREMHNAIDHRINDLELRARELEHLVKRMHQTETTP